MNIKDMEVVVSGETAKLSDCCEASVGDLGMVRCSSCRIIVK